MTKERPIKHILVSVWHSGRIHWALVAARKEGKHYRISLEAYQKIIAHAHQARRERVRR